MQESGKQMASSIWEYVSLADRLRPEEPPTEVARKGLKALLSRLHNSSTTPETIDLKAELRTIPNNLLDRLAPAPPLDDAEAALSTELKLWLDSKEFEFPAQVIIGPPGSGTGQVIKGWAQKNGYSIIEPPDSRELFESKCQLKTALDGIEEDIVVIPSLESYYFRHYNGLEAVRKLIDTLWTKKNRYVIGCSSWAWAYLSKAVMLDNFFPQPIVLQSLDGLRLKKWFGSFAAGTVKELITFRQSDNGSIIFTMNDAEDIKKNLENPKESVSAESEEGKDSNIEQEVHNFLKKLAAHCRGIPLIAWAAWRHCLYVVVEEVIDEEAKKAAAADKGITIWVKPWAQIKMPEIPTDINKCEQFILQSILIHGGLPADLICSLLPCRKTDIIRGLNRLSISGLIKPENDIWRVSLLGYPVIRSYMESENYLIDAV